MFMIILKAPASAMPSKLDDQCIFCHLLYNGAASSYFLHGTAAKKGLSILKLLLLLYGWPMTTLCSLKQPTHTPSHSNAHGNSE